MTVKALKKQLKEMGLSTKGKKADLEFRLAGALKYEELVDEDAIEDEVIEEVAQEEIAEEIAEEEEAPVEEEVEVEEPTEEKEVLKRPNTPSMRWNKEVYGKRPNGAAVRNDGVHIDADGIPVEELKE